MLMIRNEISLKTALTSIKNLGYISGLTLNINKTECILLGNLKDMYYELHGVKVINDCTKFLGIYLGQNTEKCIGKNWGKKSKNWKNPLESWKLQFLVKHLS